MKATLLRTLYSNTLTEHKLKQLLEELEENEKLVTTTKNWTLRRLFKAYKKGLIFRNQRYQRPECWTVESLRDFISCIVFKHESFGQLRLVSNKVTDSTSMDYQNRNHYDNLRKQGKQYSSIDGNNRTVCIFKFMNNEFFLKIKTGELTSKGKPIFKHVYYDKADLKKNEENLKPYDRVKLDIAEVSVVKYRNWSQEKCAQSFKSHNKSTHLNNQELRNADPYVINDYARTLRDAYDITEEVVKYTKSGKVAKNPTIYNKYRFLPPKNHRMKYEDTLVTFMHMQFYPEISPSAKHVTAHTHEVEGKEMARFDINYFIKTIEWGEKAREASGLSANASFETFYKDWHCVCNILFQRKLHVAKKHMQSFVDLFCKYRAELMKSKQTFEVSDGNKQVYPILISDRPNADPNWATRVAAINEHIVDKLLEEVPVMKPRTNLRKKDLLYELAARQGHVDNITGEEIVDPLDGSKTNVDHNLTRADGGEDTMDNFQLINATLNQKKGDDSDYVFTPEAIASVAAEG